MRRVFLLFACLLCISCTAYLYPKRQPQIFYSSKDFVTPIEPAKKIKKIYQNLFSSRDHLTIKYADGTKEEVSNKNIWGFRDTYSNVYRFYNKYGYEVYAVDVIIVYKQTGRWTNAFFSKTLDSEIYKYSRSNLKKYLDEATYQKVLENKKLNRNF